MAAFFIQHFANGQQHMPTMDQPHSFAAHATQQMPLATPQPISLSHQLYPPKQEQLATQMQTQPQAHHQLQPLDLLPATPLQHSPHGCIPPVTSFQGSLPNLTPQDALASLQPASYMHPSSQPSSLPGSWPFGYNQSPWQLQQQQQQYMPMHMPLMVPSIPMQPWSQPVHAPEASSHNTETMQVCRAACRRQYCGMLAVMWWCWCRSIVRFV